MKRFTVRGLALGALTTLILAITPGTAGFASAKADPPAPTLTATPSTDLADGQTISVTGAGYPPGHTADLVECAVDLGCDFSFLRVVTVDGSGGYTTDFFVRRILNLDAGPVDCVDAQNCILVSLDITDLSTGAQTGITFDPDIPPLPQPNFHIVPDLTGHVQVDKGVARITATIKCNGPMVLDATLTLTQVYKRHIFRTDVFPEWQCSRDATRVSVVFRPVNGLFGEGTAKLDIAGFASAGPIFVEKRKSTTVTLVASAK